MTQVRAGPAPVELSAVGNVISPHVVNVRAQVSGQLKQIFFREGDAVSAGQKLFLIDPAPYEAALAQAKAQLQIDKAALAAAKAQYDRMKPLVDKQYVTSQEYDNARAAAAEGSAKLMADEAAVKTAEINLGYTLIRAPISGRTGSIGAKTGNLVSSNDTTPLVVLNEIDKVEVQFAIPQSHLPEVQASLAKGPVQVQIFDDNAAETPLGTGKLTFIDNSIDAASGTVTLKAEVNNQAHRLWPGTFVTAMIRLAMEPNALLVPETAVQPGAEGQYVFIVDGKGKTSLRTVTVDRQVGRDLVVNSGVKPGETIVKMIPHNMQPGTIVSGIGDGAHDDSPAKASTAP
nr:efflux RND transporter periplasmic adaptor subunit [Solimonas marina]